MDTASSSGQNSFEDIEVASFFGSDIIFELIRYLDGITLTNFYLSNVIQSSLTNTQFTSTAVNYWSLSAFIQQSYFQNTSNSLNSTGFGDKLKIEPSESELYFSGNMASLKQKCCLHCDLELKCRDLSQWNEEWDDTLTLDRYQEWSTVYRGYRREQNTKFIHFDRGIPTESKNEERSNKQWMNSVEVDNLLKYLFDPKAESELKTLDIYILDYTVMRTMDRPSKFVTLENTTICFVKNGRFDDCFVAKDWQQYQA